MGDKILMVELVKRYISLVNEKRYHLGTIKITEYNKWFMIGQRVAFEGKKYNLTLKKGPVHFEVMAGDHVVKGSDRLTIGYYDKETGTGLNVNMIDENAYGDMLVTATGISSSIGSEYFIMDDYFTKIMKKLRNIFGDIVVDKICCRRTDIIKSAMVLYFIHQDFFPNRETGDMRPLMVATYVYMYGDICKKSSDLDRAIMHIINEDSPDLDIELAQIALDLECESRGNIIPAYPFIIRTIFGNIIKSSYIPLFYLKKYRLGEEIYRYNKGNEVSKTDLELNKLHDAYSEDPLNKIDCLDVRYDTWHNDALPNTLTAHCIGRRLTYLGFRINVDRVFDNTKHVYYSNGIFNFETLFTGNISASLPLYTDYIVPEWADSKIKMLKDEIGNEPATYSNIRAGKLLNEYAEKVAPVIRMISHVDSISVGYIEDLYTKLSNISDDPLACQTLRNEIETLVNEEEE